MKRIIILLAILSVIAYGMTVVWIADQVKANRVREIESAKQDTIYKHLKTKNANGNNN